MKKRMKKKAHSEPAFRRLLRRYRQIPRQLRSTRISERNRAQKLIAVTVCVPVMLYCVVYFASWELNRRHILSRNSAYREMYALNADAIDALHASLDQRSTAPAQPAATEAAPTETASVTAAAPETPSATETAAVTPAPTPLPTEAPASASPAAPTPLPALDVVSDATRAPLATADSDTLVYRLETAPPVQEAFAELLSYNPDTVGFLTVGDVISLPVVQRPGDNEYYLNHDFSGDESNGGTLFLDGANLLVPEDPCLIVYGHNMKNGTMFNALSRFEELSFLKENALIRFDTIYENRSYVPFAVFTASMDDESSAYIDIRQFVMDESEYELFVLKMQKQSLFDIPVDVRFGDRLLLLVTCEYTHENGRFVVAFRQTRTGETDFELREQLRLAKAN